MGNLGIARTIAELREQVRPARAADRRIALVPTMGALHAGHASLIRAAASQPTGKPPAPPFVVVSIFVNPTQFGPNEDFARYPRSWERDLEVCRAEGADLVFAPAAEEVYASDFRTFVEVTGLQDVLCGKSRPGHFRGVATVVLKLFNMVQPDVAYFGRKDAQQVRIIQQMVDDLNLPVDICVCPIVREPDGLALSSRNAYLTPEQRHHAPVLFRALALARDRVAQGERDADRLRQAIVALIEKTPHADLDYAEIVDGDTLQPVKEVRPGTLALLAVKFGPTRLIDNMPMV